MTTETEITEALTDGQTGTIIVEKTPFYATMGGQDADKGVIENDNFTFEVVDTIKLLGGKIGHVGVVKKGMVKTGDVVTLRVNEEIRNSTCKNHSATHLLQKALRTVLGSHVEQAGSLVTKDRLRFDFSHFQALTAEELEKVENMVNDEISKGLTVKTDIMTADEAKKTGAMALFGEKYGETVRVVSMGDFSIELCGGTHVSNTAAISSFKIISESGIAAGVRRIEALTGAGVTAYYKDLEVKLEEAARAAKTDVAQLVKKIESMQDEIKNLHSENDKLKSKIANDALGDVMNDVVDVKGVKLLAVKVSGVDMSELRNLGDQLKDKLGDGVVVIASDCGSDKVNLIAMATENAMSKGAHAGNIIKAAAAVLGGGGGGRPNMAQAGGKQPENIGLALERAKEILAEQIN